VHSRSPTRSNRTWGSVEEWEGTPCVNEYVLAVTPSLLPQPRGPATRLNLTSTMTSPSDAHVDEHLHSNIRKDAHHWALRHRQCIWTVSAAIALLSARHLLVELNFHYPLLLYLAQLVVATIITMIQHSWPRKHPDVGREEIANSSTRPATLLGIGAMSFSALSMVCMLQAIMHSKNLPTLVMLTVGFPRSW
jgi:hypothetical protein